MDVKKLYEEKLCSPEEAVKCVKSGDIVDYGFIMLKPVVCDKALAERAGELENVCVYVGLTIPPIPAIAKHPKSFIYNDWHFSKVTRFGQKQGIPIFYNPLLFSRGVHTVLKDDKIPGFRSYYFNEPEKAKDVKIIAITQATSMDENGNFNFGITNAATLAMLENVDVVIIEVNKKMPWAMGGSEEVIHISKVDYVVEAPDDQGPFIIPEIRLTKVDEMIASHIIEKIDNGATIQLGIGGIPSAVGKEIAKSDLKDLGGHTEMIVEGNIDMVESGVLTGVLKEIDKNKIVYTFAAGSQRLYDFIDKNPNLESHPVHYTNHPNTIQKFDNFVSINNAVQVDLFSQVNAESRVEGDLPVQLTGTGGMLDFVLGARLCKNGKSFICLPSTYKDKKRKIHSRIVPTFKPGTIVTVPRTLVDYIVTEYGAVQMYSCPTWMRAKKLISIAHPDFREELTEAAKKMRIFR